MIPFLFLLYSTYHNSVSVAMKFSKNSFLVFKLLVCSEIKRATPVASE